MGNKDLPMIAALGAMFSLGGRRLRKTAEADEIEKTMRDQLGAVKYPVEADPRPKRSSVRKRLRRSADWKRQKGPARQKPKHLTLRQMQKRSRKINRRKARQ